MKDKWKKTIIDFIMRGLYHVVYPLVYKIACIKEIKPQKVLLVEMHEKTLDPSFECVYEALQNSSYQISICYVRRNFCGYVEYVRRSIHLLVEMADSHYVFLTKGCNVIGAVSKRDATKVIQLWHGCGAFKKFGCSTNGLLGGTDEDVLNRFPNYKNTDYVTVSSPSVIWAYEEAMDLDKEVILPIGVSRTDIFFDKSYREKAFQKLHEIFPESIGKKVILYAPTFRGDMRDAKAPDALDLSVYASDLQDEYVFLIKHHPFSRQIPDVPAEYQSFAREVTQQMSIDECLWVSDMCISDYSSLIFEYSLFERPMIFFAYDRQDYMDWRGFYYPYEEFTPGPVCISNEEVLGAILELQQEFDKTQVRQFREKFMSSCDGHSTERILNLLEDV